MAEDFSPTPTDIIRTLIYYFVNRKKEGGSSFCFDQYDLSKVLCKLRDRDDYEEFLDDFLFNKHDIIPTSRLLNKIYANLEVSLISKSNPLLAKKKVIHKDIELYENMLSYYERLGKKNVFESFLNDFYNDLEEKEKCYATSH